MEIEKMARTNIPKDLKEGANIPVEDLIGSNLKIKVCSSREEKLACQTLSNRLLLGWKYGLRDAQLIEEWLGPLENQIYIAAFRKRGKKPVGTFRLLPDYDPTPYSNIYEGLADFGAAGHRLVDIGAYISPSAEKKSIVFEKLFAFTAGYLLELGIFGVYIQVQRQNERKYLTLGFSLATDPFFPNGWNCAWRGMFLRLDRLIKLCGDQNFQESWRKKTSVDLDVEFWRQVVEHLKVSS